MLNKSALNMFKDINSIDYKLLLLILILSIMHLACVYSAPVGILVGAIETVFVYYYLFKDKIADSLLYYGLFLITSYDNPVFYLPGYTANANEVIYGVGVLPMLHGHLNMLYMLILSYKVLSKNKFRKTNNPFVKFSRYTLVMGIVMGIIFGVIRGFSVPGWIGDLRSVISPSLFALVFYVLFTKDAIFRAKYEKVLFHTLIVYIIMGWITISLGLYACETYRENLLMLPMSSVFMSIVLLFVAKMNNLRDKMVLIICVASVIYFQLFMDAVMNGKQWIVFAVVFLVEAYLVVVKGSNIASKIVSIVAIVGAVLFLSPRINKFIETADNYKLTQFLELTEFASNNIEMDELSDSPLQRFREFQNILYEYTHQDFPFIVFGKGFGGYVHANNFFVKKSGDFSDDQYKSNQFYRMHETINSVFLKFGLAGLFMVMITLFQSILRINKNEWFFVGFIWLFFFWSYSINLQFYGLPALILAYCKLASVGQHKSDKNLKRI